jgi:hypothetical protein
MKNLAIILILFYSKLTFGQHLRLDSLVNYQSSYNHTINKYLYTSDRDFTIRQYKLNEGLITETWTILYKDSLRIHSSCKMNNGQHITVGFEYDSLRRLILFSSKGPGTRSLKVSTGYWKNSKLRAIEERVSFDKEDTTTYRIEFFTYDDQNRELTKSHFNKDKTGKINQNSSSTLYLGDSLTLINYKTWQETNDWNQYTLCIKTMPEVHFGDTLLTSHIMYTMYENENLQDSQYFKKYSWGNGVATSDEGSISYIDDQVNGHYLRYHLTDHGYYYEKFACSSGTDPDHWREDVKNKCRLISTYYVSLNQYGQPIRKEEIDAATGAVKSWMEYYYQEGDLDLKGLTPLSPSESCTIIHELNPKALYFDFSGRAVFNATGSVYLMEKSEAGLHRVLFIGD